MRAYSSGHFNVGARDFNGGLYAARKMLEPGANDFEQIFECCLCRQYPGVIGLVRDYHRPFEAIGDIQS